MQKIKDAITPFKKPLIILLIFGVFFIIVKGIIPAVNEKNAAKTPIVKIEAKNDKTYKNGAKITASDFEVKGIHKDGKKTSLRPKDFEVSKTAPAKIGKFTTVTLSLKTDKTISCKVNVKNERKKVETFACGNPKMDSVKAVLYSNGELCFEGKGDIVQYESGSYPWQQYSGDTVIQSVSFGKGVKPESLDYTFANMTNITYVDAIPSSVQSLCGTFIGDTALKETPDVSNCKNLLDMSKTYQESGIEKAVAIQESVRNADSCFENCTEIQIAPDMSKATGLISAKAMFSGCKKIAKLSLAPNVEDIENICRNCINLKEMPEIPETVKNMDSAFYGNTRLKKVTNIPQNVEKASSCFNGCTKLEGMLWIDANPKEYSGFLGDAVTATTLDLQGNSKMLDVLANTAEDNLNITVNGKQPEDITPYSDVVIEEDSDNAE